MSLEKVLFIPDTHVPYHDDRAWKVMMKAARGWKPDGIVHMGDWIDFYKISRFSKDPRRTLTTDDEIEATREKRAEVDALKPKWKKFITGNHEDRLPRYLMEKAPELFETVTVDKMLGLSENGWEITDYRDHTNVGKLYLTHDTGHSGKYTTAKALETYQHSVAIGHHHALGYLVTGDATGTHQVGAQFGWLGDIEKVDYAHRIKVKKNWSLGFGTGRHNTRTGIVYITPQPIVNYAACVEGKEYRA